MPADGLSMSSSAKNCVSQSGRNRRPTKDARIPTDLQAYTAHTLADPELRNTENVPLREDVESFFEREVKPHVPDAWIDANRRDPQDGEVGLVGYEINFNRYFYEYRPPRPLEEIEADIQQVEKEIMAMLREVAG